MKKFLLGILAVGCLALTGCKTDNNNRGQLHIHEYCLGYYYSGDMRYCTNVTKCDGVFHETNIYQIDTGTVSNNPSSNYNGQHLHAVVYYWG